MRKNISPPAAYQKPVMSTPSEKLVPYNIPKIKESLHKRNKPWGLLPKGAENKRSHHPGNTPVPVTEHIRAETGQSSPAQFL